VLSAGGRDPPVNSAAAEQAAGKAKASNRRSNLAWGSYRKQFPKCQEVCDGLGTKKVRIGIAIAVVAVVLAVPLRKVYRKNNSIRRPQPSRIQQADPDGDSAAFARRWWRQVPLVQHLSTRLNEMKDTVVKGRCYNRAGASQLMNSAVQSKTDLLDESYCHGRKSK
jgi:hypothetical protein